MWSATSFPLFLFYRPLTTENKDRVNFGEEVLEGSKEQRGGRRWRESDEDQDNHGVKGEGVGDRGGKQSRKMRKMKWSGWLKK